MPVGGDADEAHAPRAHDLAHQPGQRVAVHLRQVVVDQHDPVPALAQEAQAEEAVRRHVGAVALRRAQGADEVLRIRIVLDQ